MIASVSFETIQEKRQTLTKRVPPLYFFYLPIAGEDRDNRAEE